VAPTVKPNSWYVPHEYEDVNVEKLFDTQSNK
jgi:hypothetical protein